MARDTQVIELDFRSGVESNESGFAVGPRLRRSQNAMWRPYASQDDLRRRILSMPNALAPGAFYTLTNGTHDSPYRVLASVSAEDVPPSFGVITSLEKGTNHFLIHSAVNGSLLSDTGVAITDLQQASGAAVYWPDINTPTIYVTHPALGAIYKIDNTGVHTYTAANDPGESYLGNAALEIHLDRLWIPKNRKVFYTDPLDPNTVRATSFVRFDDIVTSLFRASSSPVDAGAGTHLCVGLRKGVWVIDGDPAFGNAVGRRLIAGVGLADQTLVCETAYGAVCLLTDGQFYLIPNGATQITPIGTPIRDQVTAFGYRLGVTTSLQWVPPYVYVCFANLNVMWALDLSDPSAPKWWGPITHAAGSRQGRILPTLNKASEFLIGAPTDVAPVPIYPMFPVVNSTGRSTVLVTGYASVPGRRIEMKRLTVETVRLATPITLKVTAHWADGTRQSQNRTLSVLGTTGTDIIGKTVFDFSPHPVISDFCWFELEWPVGVQPDVHRAYVEIRTQPRQDIPGNSNTIGLLGAGGGGD